MHIFRTLFLIIVCMCVGFIRFVTVDSDVCVCGHNTTHTHNGTFCSIERSRCWFQYSSLFGGRNIVNLNGFQCVPHADMMGRPRHQPTVSTNGKGGIDRGFCSFITRPLCDHVRSISLPIFSYRHQYHVLDPMVFSVYHVHWLK